MPVRATPRVLALLLASAVAAPLGAQPSAPAVSSLVPLPASVSRGAGMFVAPARLAIVVASPADAELRRLGDLAAAIAREGLSATPGRQGAGTAGPALVLALAPADSVNGAESYRLVVDSSGIVIRAPRHAGIFYGLQTLRQLLDARELSPGDVRARRTLAAVGIADAPRFRWRGLHLDVARHFMPVAFVKRYIDHMARFKFNTFHWHLTDDQGWRVPIRRYPRLTSVGGCRAETIVEKRFDPYVGDGRRYCGSYTREEIREVVAYARERFVTVVPEIEMPGHARAALAAYPHLACTPGPFTVGTKWGVEDDIFCPKEETFAFLEQVLAEVMELFPSEYIHIGGDEAPKVRWKASPVAQEVIRREGLKDEHELQSWFIRRIERFLNARGRRLVGWDEILEGGLAPDATVMSWRGMSGGIAAAREGHDVIMSPTSHAYLDYYQGDPRFEPLAIGGNLPLERVYGFEPVPDTLTPAQRRHVIGVQGNVWTEYLKTPRAVEYMVWPRALALAEVAWTPRERRAWEGFAARLPARLRALERLGVHYRLPHVEGLEQDRLTLDDSVTVALRTLLPRSDIRYTLDGSDPTARSPRYRAPLRLAVDARGVQVTARAFTSAGTASAPRRATFARATLRAAAPVSSDTLATGLRVRYVEGTMSRVARVDSLPVVREGLARSVGLEPAGARAEHFALRFDGWVRVPASGVWTFTLTSDDGSVLAIGERVVVDHDGPHGTEPRSGSIALAAGLHPVTIRFFQGEGGKSLSLSWRVDDGPDRPVPPDALFGLRDPR